MRKGAMWSSWWWARYISSCVAQWHVMSFAVKTYVCLLIILVLNAKSLHFDLLVLLPSGAVRQAFHGPNMSCQKIQRKCLPTNYLCIHVGILLAQPWCFSLFSIQVLCQAVSSLWHFASLFWRRITSVNHWNGTADCHGLLPRLEL